MAVGTRYDRLPDEAHVAVHRIVDRCVCGVRNPYAGTTRADGRIVCNYYRNYGCTYGRRYDRMDDESQSRTFPKQMLSKSMTTLKPQSRSTSRIRHTSRAQSQRSRPRWLLPLSQGNHHLIRQRWAVLVRSVSCRSIRNTTLRISKAPALSRRKKDLWKIETNISAGIHVLMGYARTARTAEHALAIYNAGASRWKAGRSYARTVLQLTKQIDG